MFMSQKCQASVEFNYLNIPFVEWINGNSWLFIVVYEQLHLDTTNEKQ